MYEYVPLERPDDEIRLLYIHPAGWDEDMSCHLRTYNLDTAPAYKAISYTWGAESPLFQIWVDRKPILVRWNCLYALRQARLHGGGDLDIWIDSICINQQDLLEKSAQFAMMGDIFERAHCVFSCLGAMVESTSFLFNTFGTLALVYRTGRPCDDCNICQTLSPSQSQSKYKKAASDWLVHTLKAGPDEIFELCFAVQEFALRPYWSRLWILQDVLLAQVVFILCGRRIFPMDDFSVAYNILQELRPASPDYEVLLLAMPEELRRGAQNMTKYLADGYAKLDHNALGYILTSINSQGSRKAPPSLRAHSSHRKLDLDHTFNIMEKLHCADARDRVYGLIRVISWPPWCGPPVPDYTMTAWDLANDVSNRLSRDMEPYAMRKLLEALRVGAIPENEDRRMQALLDMHPP